MHIRLHPRMLAALGVLPALALVVTALVLLAAALAGCSAAAAPDSAAPDSSATDDSATAQPEEVTAASPSAPHPRPARTEREPLDDDEEALAARLAPSGAQAHDARQRVTLFTARDADDPFVETWRDRAALALAQLRRVFPPYTEPVEPARLLIFAERGRFEAYADHFAPENHHALGYYDPQRRELVMAEPRTEDPVRAKTGLLATLLHETTHLVLRDFLDHRFPPAWLDEGLATYYETGRLVVDAESGEALFEFGAVHKEFLRRVGRHLEGFGTVDLRRFATLSYDEFIDVGTEELRLHYAVAWSLVYYLLNGDGGRYREALQLYLGEIGAAPDARMRYVRAFDTCFSPVLDSFEVGWANWARQATRMR